MSTTQQEGGTTAPMKREAPSAQSLASTSTSVGRKPKSPGVGSVRSSGWGSVLRLGAGARRQPTVGTMSRGSASIWGLSSMAGGSRRRKTRPGMGTSTGAATEGGFAPAMIVRDQDGVDVTPKSLLSLKPTALLQHSELADLQQHSSSRGSSAGSSEFGDRSTFSFSLAAAGSDLRSGISSSMSTPRTARTTASEAQQQQQQQGDAGGSSSQQTTTSSSTTSLKDAETMEVSMSTAAGRGMVVIERNDDAEMRAQGLNELVTVRLTETETQWLLSIEGSSIDESSPFAEDARERNARYEALCKRNALGNESLVNREMQTSSGPRKMKETQTSPARQHDSGCQASEADIYDTFATAAATKEAEAMATSTTSSTMPTTTIQMPVLDQEPGAWVDVDASDVGPEALQTRRTTELDRFLHSTAAADALRTLERVIMQTEEQHLLAFYRNGFREGEGTGQTLELLWRYEVESLTKGRNETLAVGYGEFDCKAREEHATRGGLILVWSLASIRHPDFIVHTPADVTALAFSARHPALLAAGMADGSVVVYSLQAHCQAVALSAPAASSRGGDPVWELRWLEGVADVGESLVSAGANGRVLLWGFRRGLEVRSELMHLTSAHNPAKTHGAGAGAGAGALRHAGALSLDMHPSVRGIYLVATDGGLLHKCSASYSDQYLQTYIGHVGPVVCVRWNPFSPSVFVSAGADWTLRLWEQDRGSAPSLTLSLDPATSSGSSSTSQKSVDTAETSTSSTTSEEAEKAKLHQHYHPFVPVPEFPTDVCWSMAAATVLACTAGNSLQIWNLAVSTMDPVHVVRMQTPQTCAAFSPDANILVAGSADGAVSVFRVRTDKLYNAQQQQSKEQQRDTLENLLAEVVKQAH